jgi:hypothetical protein
VIRQRPEGKTGDKFVEYKDRVCKRVSCEKVEGIEPVRELALKMRTRRAANLPNSGEIEPTNKFPPTSMEVRPVSVERVEETEPVKRLLFRFKDDSLVSPPR